jgi:hypothetical protein
MDKHSKILLWVLVFVTVATVGYKYVQFYINKDYTFLTQVDCDPETEMCFQLLEENQDTETRIIYYDGSPYKYVEMPAAIAPQCLEETTCPEFTCADVDGECETYYCDPEDEESFDPEWEECIS